MNSKARVVFVLSSFIAGCTTTLEAEFLDVKFVDSPREFTAIDSVGIIATTDGLGQIEARIASVDDLLKVVFKETHSAHFRIRKCDDLNTQLIGSRIWNPSHIDSMHVYSALITLRGHPLGTAGVPYDLTMNPGDICLQFAAQIKAPFRRIKTNWIVVPMSTQFIQEISSN